jgi:hypothetical protein
LVGSNSGAEQRVEHAEFALRSYRRARSGLFRQDSFADLRMGLWFEELLLVMVRMILRVDVIFGEGWS